jgi:hypothetical protein
MNIEINENPSYYAWTVHVNGSLAGMVVKEPSGGYTCPRGKVSGRVFQTVEAAAQALAEKED